MTTSTVFLILAVLSATWASGSAVLLTRFLDQRGLVTPFPLMRLLLFRNLEWYKEITRDGTGKVGPLFYSYIAAINLAFVFAVIALAAKFSGN